MFEWQFAYHFCSIIWMPYTHTHATYQSEFEQYYRLLMTSIVVETNKNLLNHYRSHQIDGVHIAICYFFHFKIITITIFWSNLLTEHNISNSSKIKWPNNVKWFDQITFAFLFDSAADTKKKNRIIEYLREREQDKQRMNFSLKCISHFTYERAYIHLLWPEWSDKMKKKQENFFLFCFVSFVRYFCRLGTSFFLLLLLLLFN